MAVGRGVALGSNSIPVPGSPSFREPATSEDELSLGGVVGEDAGSLVRMPHASAAGMTRAANTNVARGADSLCTTRGHLIHQSSSLIPPLACSCLPVPPPKRCGLHEAASRCGNSCCPGALRHCAFECSSWQGTRPRASELPLAGPQWTLALRCLLTGWGRQVTITSTVRPTASPSEPMLPFPERRRKVRSYPLGAVHLYLSDGVQTNLCHPGRAAYTTGVEAWIQG